MPLVTEPIGTSCLRPSRKEWLKDMPAHLPVELAYAIDLAAATDRKLGHIEGFRSISRVLPSHREQVLKRDREFVLRIMTEIFAKSLGSKRSNPAVTAVCVVKRFPARVTFMARSNGFL